ncbi:2-oxo acid dehydrogenase subunit E2 [bacterium]|nr:2-oxo acid dehydrogenase subunit E2 [bacterium]
MSHEITMPKLSDTMTEGTLVSWKKAVGEQVERGDIVAEVETDKAVMELEAFASGILLETRAEAGELVPVGTVIGIIGVEGEKPSPQAAQEEVTATEQQTESHSDEEMPEVREEAAQEAVPVTDQQAEPPADEEMPEEREEDSERAEAPSSPPSSGTEKAPLVKASPVVRRLARENGIDLDQVEGSGPEGRILKEDLEAFLAAREQAKSPSAAPASEPAGGPLHQAETHPAESKLSAASAETLSGPLSGMRAAIASTVAESWRTIPHFNVTVDIDMTAAENLHQGLKEADTHVSLTDIIIRAAALALKLFPRLNASLAGDRLEVHPEIHLAVAVDVPDGVLLPVVKNCEVLSLREIALRSRDLFERARAGHLRQTEISGGTFTISNLGMFGVTEFTALIPPGQSGILAVGAITSQAVVRNGQVTISRVMKTTLSADHRVVDGAYGAGFLRELSKCLENPVRLLV